MGARVKCQSTPILELGPRCPTMFFTARSKPRASNRFNIAASVSGADLSIGGVLSVHGARRPKLGGRRTRSVPWKKEASSSMWQWHSGGLHRDYRSLHHPPRPGLYQV